MSTSGGAYLNLAFPLLAAPIEGAVVYTPVFFSLADASPGTISLVLLGDGYQYLLTGNKSTPPKLALNAKGRVMMEFSFQVDHWEEILPDGLYTTLDAISLTIPGSIVTRAIPFLLGPDASGPALSQFPVTELVIDAGGTVTPQNAVTGTDGRIGFTMSDLKPIVSGKPYFQTSLKDLYSNATSVSTLVQMGMQNGYFVTYLMSGGQLSALPGEIDVSGFVSQDLKVQAMVRDDQGVQAKYMFF